MKLLNTVITKHIELTPDEFNHLRNRIQSRPNGEGYYLTEGAIELFYETGKQFNFITGPSHSREGFLIEIPTSEIITIAENVPILGTDRRISFLKGKSVKFGAV
jgi:hypothetical protein